MLSPRMSVAWPTRTPATSVIALSGPGGSVPMTTPRSRARGRVTAMARISASACMTCAPQRIMRNPTPGKKPSKSQTKQKAPGVERKMKPRADHGERSYRGSGKLEDLAAIITGGDSGIGRAVAIAFAREGADVSIVYLDEHEDAKETQRLVEEKGRRCLLIAGDVGDESFCREVVEKTVDE